jgi:hypothetical protein
MIDIAQLGRTFISPGRSCSGGAGPVPDLL